MLGTLTALLPVLAGLACGWGLRQWGVATAADGRFLLLLSLYVLMPALILRSLPEVTLTREIAVFPLAAALMVGVGCLVGYRSSCGRPREEGTVVVMALMVVNVAFALPFVEAVHGPEGIARLAAFDAVNNVLVLTVVNALAARANPTRVGRVSSVGQVLRTPPIYATAIGLGLSLTGTPLPEPVALGAAPFAAASPIVIAIGTGVLFRPSRSMLGRAGRLAVTRVVTGAAVAVGLVAALGLEGTDAEVLLLLGVAPLGFVTVTFAAQQRLDDELATQALALSLLLSGALSLTLVLL